MKAWIAGQTGPELADIPVPVAGPDDVLVRVQACALNRADLAMAQGVRHGAAGGAGAVLGLEWAGEVVAVGARVQGVGAGERVMGSSAAAFAEYAVADAGRAMRAPERMSVEQAAALPVALQTMHDAVVTHGGVGAGATVLVLGASSGVGLMALQIARAKGAALVVGSSTNAERRARLADYGAHLTVDTNDRAWVQQVRDATGGAGVDVAIDQVTGALASQTLHAVRVLGRIVNVGRLGGNHADFDFDIHARRRITFVGVTFRTRSKEEVREIVQKMQADIWPLLETGKLTLPISHRFAFGEMPEALRAMAENRHFGKIVVAV